jgi:hypothetical protein
MGSLILSNFIIICMPVSSSSWNYMRIEREVALGKWMEHSRKQLKELFSLLNALRGMNRKIGLRRATLSFINLTRFFFPSLCTNTQSAVGRQDRPAHQQKALFASELLSLHTHRRNVFFFFLVHSAPLLALAARN